MPKTLANCLFFSWLVLAGFSSASAMFLGNVFGTNNTLIINNVYYLTQAFDLPEFGYVNTSSVAKHGVADDGLKIDPDTIQELLQTSKSFNSFGDSVRLLLINKMINHGWNNRESNPYAKQEYAAWNNQILLISSGTDYIMSWNLWYKDDLDKFLEDELNQYKDDRDQWKKYNQYAAINSIQIDKKLFSSWEKLLLFRSKEDLDALGYDIVSYRTRISHDKGYRRYNISTAFANIGNVRILNPGDVFDFRNESTYSRYNSAYKKAFARGYAIVGGAEKRIYGWGLCGAATAVYQWILTNLAVDIVERRPHSIWYKSLFEASVNGEYISTPGLDATIYKNDVNIQFENNRDYPIVVVFNFDGSKWGEEQVFSLAKDGDKWNFEFLYRKWKCFSWKINSEVVKNCYGLLK